jgi:hypothetical protein
LARCAFFSALQSIGLELPAVGEQRDLRIGEQLDLADEAVAASELARAA